MTNGTLEKTGTVLLHTAVLSRRDDGDVVGLGDERTPIEDTIFGDIEPSSLKGTLYRFGLAEYGRCIGKVYVDSKSRGTVHTGYVFEQRMPYEDNPSQSSVIETWLTVERVVEQAQPTVVESVEL